ncbi:MAG TPA: 2-phospho-L-lactate transferase [Candidatus Saccharimonadales bacterium]|nr:2-phospho-L-lactate transferase [Candidatus Saccharimonadales bacterium]
MKVTLLSGGTGGAKLATGMAAVLPATDLSIVVNTADDDEFWGLLVSPDIDAILYRLAGVFNAVSGFGVRNDTFAALDMLRTLGEDTWFQLGDRDIGMHLLRATLMRGGLRLTEAVAQIAHNLGIGVAVLPMSDDPVRTRMRTATGELSLQEWFVREHSRPPLLGIRFAGAEVARPAPEALTAIADADAVIVGPSNPIVSVDPILAVLGDSLDRERVTVISPIVGGRSLKGPTVEMLGQLGEEANAFGVARRYAGIAAGIVIDSVDADLREPIRALGMRVLVADTVMADAAGERRVAAALLQRIESTDGS